MNRGTLLAGLAALVAVTASPAQAGASRYAVVIGQNRPLDGSEYTQLRYADDDAIHFAELMELLGAEVQLLAEPDLETRQAGVAPLAAGRAPTRDAVMAALAKVRDAVAAGGRAGSEVFFYFSGHGSVTGATAWLHLADGRFTRTDLYRELLDAVDAEQVHVIIDSCHSYLLVNTRGERVRAEPEHYDPDRYANAGFLLSTDSGREAHEWEGFGAGVFSYLLRGALMGAADTDGDGRVTYAEVFAYVSAAVATIEEPRARIRPFIRSSRRDQQVVDLRQPPRRCVVVPEEVDGHLQVWSGAGRLLDAHKQRGHALHLALPAGRVELEAAGSVWGAQCDPRRPGRFIALAAASDGPAVRTRGRVADAFRAQLFEQPLTPEYSRGFEHAYEAMLLAPRAPGESQPWYRDGVAWALLGGGVAAASFGGLSASRWLDARGDAQRRPVTLDTERHLARASDWRAATAAGFTAATALLGGALLRVLLSEPDAPETSEDP